MRPRSFLAALAAPLCLPGPAGAATWSVQAGGGGDFATIAAALAAAADGDTIEVGPGIYTEDLDFGGRDVAVLGTQGAASTTIAGTGLGPVVTFTTGEGPGAVLEGFTITGGVGGAGSGGGLHVDGASPTLADLVVQQNTATAGGGARLSGSDATLTDVLFEANAALPTGGGAEGWGGGLYAIDSVLTLERVSFVANDALRGGGAFLRATIATLVDVEAHGNSADRGGGLAVEAGNVTATGGAIAGNTASVNGGGLYLFGGTGGQWEAVLIEANEAPDGAGARISDASPSLVACAFVDNVALGNGGGLLVDAQSGSAAPFLTSVLFDGNEADVGGGVLLDATSITASGCRFVGNRANALGGGLYAADATNTSLHACVFDGNTAVSDGGAVRYQGGTGHLVASSVFAGNSASNGAAIHVAFGAAVSVEHATFAGNGASSGGTVRATADGTLAMINSIVALPSLGSAISVADGAAWTLRYVLAWATTAPSWSGGLPDLDGVDGNQSADPAFAAYTANGVHDDDLHLAPGSPAIDAGDPGTAFDPDGSRADLGAYGGPGGDLLDTLPPAGLPGAGGDDDDDDDDSSGDDDSADDDDDATPGDDDDATPGDDDDLLDDDDTSPTPPPDTGGCSCHAADSTGASALFPLALLAFARARRRP